MLSDALDRSVLTGRVAPLENDENLLFGFNDVTLKFDEFNLRRAQRRLVVRFRSRVSLLLLGRHRFGSCFDPFRKRGDRAPVVRQLRRCGDAESRPSPWLVISKSGARVGGA